MYQTSKGEDSMAMVLTRPYELERSPRLIIQCRVFQSTMDLSVDGVGTNNPFNLPVDLAITALSGTTRRGYGVHMRGVLLQWTGSPPSGYNPSVRQFVPILRRNRFLAIRIGSLGTYLGVRVRVVSKIPETIGA